MAKLSKDEWISLFNKFINESDSNTLSFFFKIFIQYNALKFILHTQPIHPVNHILQPPVEHFSERL